MRNLLFKYSLAEQVIYEFENLTFQDNVHVFSTNISQLVLKINGKLTLGKNVSIRVCNGFYPETPEYTK